MKVRISNYDKLISRFLDKSENADQKQLFNLSSKYFKIAQKLYKYATAELDEFIEKNKKAVRDEIITNMHEFLQDNPKKDQIIHFIQSLEYPYNFNIGNVANPIQKKALNNIFNIALTMFEKGTSPDIALAIADNHFHILNYIQEHQDLLPFKYDSNDENSFPYFDWLEYRKEQYGFVNERRMEFRTPALLLDIYFGLHIFDKDKLPNLVPNRKDYFDYLYSDENGKMGMDKEHFDSALAFNLHFGKQSIQFLKKCHEEFEGNPISDVPHIVDNSISLFNAEYHPTLGQFIIDNYFKFDPKIDLKRHLEAANLYSSKDIESMVKEYTDPNQTDPEILRKAKVEFSKIKANKRVMISLIATNWLREVRINETDYSLVKDISGVPIERISKIVENDTIANDIGTENIENYALFEEMLKHQKDEIKNFLIVQKLAKEAKTSSWYEDLCKVQVENNFYIGRLLEKSDPRFPFVGAITGCCQKINGHGDNAFQNTFGIESGIFIVTDKKDNIVAQSYVWINDISLTLDSIESKYDKLHDKEFREIYDLACQNIFSKYFELVLLGNNNTPSGYSGYFKEEKFVTTDFLENNDPLEYTYDTQNGRSVIYQDENSTNPFVSILNKLKNNLSEIFSDDDISYLATDPPLFKFVTEKIVDTYTEKIDDVISLDNVYRLFENTKYSQTLVNNMALGFEILANLYRGAECDFSNLQTTEEFYIKLNFWLRNDGLKLLAETKDESLKRDFHFIQQEFRNFHPTKLYFAELFKYTKNEPNDILPSIQPDDAGNLFDTSEFYEYISKNISFIDGVRKFVNPDLVTLRYGKTFNTIFKIIAAYKIKNNNFTYNDLMIFERYKLSENEYTYLDSANNNGFIDTTDYLINEGLLDLYFEKGPNSRYVIPSSNTMHIISRRYVGTSGDESLNPDKLKSFTEKIIENLEFISYKDEYGGLGNIINNSLRNNLLKIDLNEANLQKYFGEQYINFSGRTIANALIKPIKYIYSSNWKLFGHLIHFDDPSLYEQEVTFFINDDAYYVGIHNLPISILNVKMKSNIDDFKKFVGFAQVIISSKPKYEIRFDRNDIIAYIDETLRDFELKKLVLDFRLKTQSDPNYDISKFTEQCSYDIAYKITYKFPENTVFIIDYVKQKVGNYINWLKSQPSLPAELSFLVTGDSSTNQAQREIQSSNRKIIKYSIKRK